MSTFAYDEYGRLEQITDDVWASGSSSTTKSWFDYTYDAASNLLKEEYEKVDGSAGDRFAYDAYHRLTTAWMGVNSTTMAASSDPTGFNASTMHAELTYSLDGANNRTSTSVETSGGTVASTYARQGSSHPQGASNRYDTITTSGNAVVMDYDGRGNLIYDGNFAYFYDYMNRLQEVYKVVPAEGLAMQEGEKFALVEDDSAAEARSEIHDEIPDLMQRIVREHMDPVFRARLKKYLRGGVIRLLPAAQNGGGVSQFADDATLELVAVYIYDGFNRRTISVWVGEDQTQFHTYDGWRQIGQYSRKEDGSNVLCLPQKQFMWGSRLDELVCYRRRTETGSWENYFVLHGGQDTAAKLVDEDGNVVEQYEYDPYGKVTVYDGSGSLVGDGSVSGVGLPFLWKGIRLDSETGLLYMRNRYYSTAMGRFQSGDPLGAWFDLINGGNGYAYVGNRPLVLGDSLGLQTDRIPSVDRQAEFEGIRQQAIEARDDVKDLMEQMKRVRDKAMQKAEEDLGKAKMCDRFETGFTAIGCFMGGLGAGIGKVPLPQAQGLSWAAWGLGVVNGGAAFVCDWMEGSYSDSAKEWTEEAESANEGIDEAQKVIDRANALISSIEHQMSGR